MRFSIRRFRIVCAAFILIPFLGIAAFAGETESSTDSSTPSALAKGRHPLGSYSGGDFDAVNPFNGGLSFHIPLAMKDGRGGMHVSVLLTYSSKIWRMEKVGNGLDAVYAPVYDPWDSRNPEFALGWRITAGRMEMRRSGIGADACAQQSTVYDKTLTVLTFVAPDATEYSFRETEALTHGDFQDLSGCSGVSRGRIFEAVDGTAATFLSDNPIVDDPYPGNENPNLDVNGVVFLRDGTRFRIEGGAVVWRQDRNGNRVNFLYEDMQAPFIGGKLLRVTDNLGRTMSLTYGTQATPTEITYAGVNGATRVVQVFRPKLDAALAAGQSLSTGSQLFPDGGVDAGFGTFNPRIVSKIVLPSGHQWEFKYNSHGEVSEVHLPSGGVIRYTHVGAGPSQSSVIAVQTGLEIFRRVAERRTFTSASAGSFASKTAYSTPVPASPTDTTTTVTETRFNLDDSVNSATRHEYYGTVTANYLRSGGVPASSGYRPWKEGKEYRTSELASDASTVLRVIDVEWTQRAGTWLFPNDPDNPNQPENDPRVASRTVTLRDVQPAVSSKVVYEYDDQVPYNNVDTEFHYDYAQSGTGALLSKVVRVYETSNAYTSILDSSGAIRTLADIAHIRSLVKREEIHGPSGIETADETVYDEYTIGGYHNDLTNRSIPANTVAGEPVTYKHASNRGTSWSRRGNPTTVRRAANAGAATKAESYVWYDITGNAVRVIGARVPDTSSINEYGTEIGYSAANHFAYPALMTQRVSQTVGGATSLLALTTEKNHDFNTGAVLWMEGPNGDLTAYEYADPLDRLTREIRPSGFGESQFQYSAPTQALSLSVTDTFDTRAVTATSFFDGLGRPETATKSDAGGQVSTFTMYDGLSRPYLTSNPMRTAPASTDGWTRATFDALGRAVEVGSFSGATAPADAQQPDMGKVQTVYRNQETEVTDQANKKRSSHTDALGRMTKVVEDPGGLNYETLYTHDARSNLKTVTQTHGAVSQVRVFAYDERSRVIFSRMPEQVATISGAGGPWSAAYVYDKDSNLVSRTCAGTTGISTFTTNNTYDSLNRIRSTDYSNTSGGSADPDIL